MPPRNLALLAALALAVAGCQTVVDPTVETEIGPLVPALVDSDLASQVVEPGVNPPGTIQNMYWKLVPTLALGIDDVTVDLTGEADCTYFDAAGYRPLAAGRCAAGTVVNGNNVPVPGTLAVIVSEIVVQRVKPLELLPDADYDGDTVPNETDNCPLVDNPDQTDTGMKGFGDACSVIDPFTLVNSKDSDADGVPDRRDNCTAVPNPSQTDSGMTFPGPPFSRGVQVPDGIGDACEADVQTATVRYNGNTSNLPLSFAFDMENLIQQPFRLVGWLVIDFKDQASLSCDWAAHTCDLMISGVQNCSSLTTNAGCF